MFPIIIFSERLLAIRKSKSISAKEVAESIGVSKAAMSQFESGKNPPSASVLIDLADYFDVSIDYLVGRSDDPKRY